MVNLNNPGELASVLSMLSANDTATVKGGEKLLKPFLKQPQCVLHLFNQLQTSTDVSIRHHSALLLKKKLGMFYPNFGAQHQTEIKTQLINQMIAEPIKVVRIAIAGCVASVAKAVFTHGQAWPELFNMLIQLAQDPNENLRTLNFHLLAQLCEQVSGHLVQHVGTLSQMFVMGCQDNVTAVAIAALSATTTFIMELGNVPEVMPLQVVISPMLGVMSKCLSNGEDETVIEGLDVIQECCMLEQPLINDHIDVIVQFIMTIIQNNDCEASIRQAAGQTFMNIVECRPKLFASKQLVGPSLAVLMEMVAKQDSSAAGSLFTFQERKDGDDEDEDEDELDVQRLSQIIVDCMAVHIPSKYFVEPALQLCSQGMGSADANMRKAGCAVLGVIAEGCSDRIRELMDGILPRLLQLVQDPEYYVRECACFALGQFSEYCQPDILRYSDSVLPVVFQALDDPRHTVQVTSCYVLEYFCESLQADTLRPYLNPLMTKLATLLQNTDKKIAKEMALSAIAAAAVAAEIDFLPFVETVCGLLQPHLFNSDKAYFALRGRALECLGHIAVAVGGQHFARYFPVGMQCAQEGLQFNDEDLKEHCFIFIANASKVMGKAFESYLPTLVPYLMDVIAESEISFFAEDEEEEEDGAGVHVDDPNDPDYEDDDDGDYRLNVEEGFVNTKKAAITALGSLAEHTKELYGPYLDISLKGLMEPHTGPTSSLHGVIRAEALSSLQYFLQVACLLNGITTSPPAGQAIALPPLVAQMTSVILNAYITCLTGDREKLPVAYSIEAIGGVLKQVGVAALHLSDEQGKPLGDKLMKCVKELLAEKALCQSKYEGQAHDDDDDDHDNVVMDAVTDLVGELARVMKEGFVNYFDDFHKNLLKFTKPSRAHSDRSMAIGCYAEVVAEIGPAAMKYAEVLLQVIQVSLSDPMEGVRRNAAFCIAMLVHATGTALSAHFLPILTWLHPLCIRKDEAKTADAGGADVDNALAAVAQMIKAAPSAIPIGQVLPVMLSGLPLRNDFSEGANIYGCISALVLQQAHPEAIPLVPQILIAFGETLSKQSHAEDDTKTIAVEFFKGMAASAQFHQPLANYFTSLQSSDGELLQNIQNLMASSNWTASS